MISSIYRESNENEFSDQSACIYNKIERPPVLDPEMVRSHRWYQSIRRIQDLLFSSVALLLLLLPMALVALVIWLDSPGASPIYKQKRVGRDGREFWMLKFRSMIPHAENMLEEMLKQNEMDGPVFKIRQDPRITKVGRFIRRTSIDELPQLFNILMGDMSLVGPRPALPREVEQYGEYEKQRLYVTPGLTCLWQIQPKRNTLSFEEWLELDIKYIRDRSFSLDWKIIFATLVTVLRGDGE